MIKDCNVLINNEAVTVFDYDGTQVQVPSIRRKATTVRVVKKNNQYIVVDDNYKEEPAQKVAEKPQKKTNKKTTIDKNANKTRKTEDKSEKISE